MGNQSGKAGAKQQEQQAQAATGSRMRFRENRARRNSAASITGMYSDVREKYKIDPKELGHGHYGVVRRCQDRLTGEWFACKTIKKIKVSRIESLKREIEILRTVDHPNIIRLVDVFEDEKYLHLVQELCTGGELFERIIKKTQSREGRYNEADAAKIVRKILSAIEYCHTVHNICHRDLKPENFLFLTSDEDAELKIIDFGLSRFEDSGVSMRTRVGTPYYIAPEVLNRNYDKSCDMWSIGVISYILLCGFPPFYGDNDQEIFASVRRARFDFPSPEWDNISDEAKQFVTSLLQLDPARRPTATEALHHDWVTNTHDHNKHLAMNVKDSLSRFVGMNRLKKVALNVIAQQLTEAEIGNLREIFNSVDKDHNGVITISELETAMDSMGLSHLKDEIAALMRGVDVKGNNEFHYSDFLAATMEVNQAIREKNIRHAFRHFDQSGAGEITMADLVRVMGSEQHAREVVGELDLNGDGNISYEEFKAMMQGIRQGSNRYKELQSAPAESKATTSNVSTPRHSLDEKNAKVSPFSATTSIGRRTNSVEKASRK